MRLNKRACRKLADPTWKMNLNSGLFCADQLQYIVRSAVRNVDHQRVLILYVYDREQVNVGETRPLWTVFQSREQYITLARREDGAVYWRKAAFDNLSRQPSFRNKCAFYSLNDEKKVMRFCKEDKKDGFACLDSLQSRIMHQSTLQRRHSKQRKIIERMETVPGLPRGLKSWIHKEIMPVYIFYTYSKGAKEMVGYCTACRRSVKVSGIKHNTEGCCPLCKKAVTYKSRGRRGNVLDRETLQVLQRISDTELVVRFVKIYRRYPMPTFQKRIFMKAPGYLFAWTVKVLQVQNTFTSNSTARILHHGKKVIVRCSANGSIILMRMTMVTCMTGIWTWCWITPPGNILSLKITIRQTNRRFM